MEKYHINKKTNRPNLCDGRNCSFFKAHYPSKAAAQAMIEKKNAKKLKKKE